MVIKDADKLCENHTPDFYICKKNNNKKKKKKKKTTKKKKLSHGTATIAIHCVHFSFRTHYKTDTHRHLHTTRPYVYVCGRVIVARPVSGFMQV